MANKSSSVKPNSGLRSTAASARSSSAQQQRVGERHQVHDRDMLGQHKAVGAGHLDALVLERADDRLEQRPALAHQDEHIAIARGAALDADRQRARRPYWRTVRAIRCASFTRGLVSLTVSNGASQPSISLALVRFRPAPRFRPGSAAHPARRYAAESRRCPQLTLAAIALRLEHLVDGAEHALAGAERVLELAEDEIQSAVVDARARNAGASARIPLGAAS